MKSRLIICTLLLFGLGCNVKVHKNNTVNMGVAKASQLVCNHLNA